METTRKRIRKKWYQNPAKNIAFSFIGLILLGAFLLCLPISNANGQAWDTLSALFTATSATCVTGLSLVAIGQQFSIFGQVIMLVLIQIGGLGVMTLVAIVLTMMKSRLSINNKTVIKSMLNLDGISGLPNFVLNIICYTLMMETIGALLLSITLVPQHGTKGIWEAIFVSISAFCNAGFDILGTDSLIPYALNPLFLYTIMGLILCGGLGFVVWFDIRDHIVTRYHDRKNGKQVRKYLFDDLCFHSKLVLVVSLIVTWIPALLILLMECQNPSTLGTMSWFDKINNALFSSVTLRTAGFASIAMEKYRTSSSVLMMLIMMVGGSPGGTAGGVKTTTITVLLLCVYSAIKGESHPHAFRRNISWMTIVQATTVLTINLAVAFIGVMCLCISETQSFLPTVFEVVSALNTVGLSMNLTASLSRIGQGLVIVLMFVGRVGIITFLMSIVKKDGRYDKIRYAEGHVLIG